MDALLARLKQQEDEVKVLETQLFSRPEFHNNRQLDELRSENDKLNYRATILHRVSIERSIGLLHSLSASKSKS